MCFWNCNRDLGYTIVLLFNPTEIWENEMFIDSLEFFVTVDIIDFTLNYRSELRLGSCGANLIELGSQRQ